MAISSKPLNLDCMFSSVIPGGILRPLKPVKILSIVFIPFSISRYEYSIPNLEDANLASSRLSSLVYGLGIITAFTRLGPRASVAMAATKAESIPPDIPRTTPGKPLLRT